MENNILRYKIATLILKEISNKGRSTMTSFLEQKARNEFLQDMVEDDERFFDLYVASAIELLKGSNLIKQSENGNTTELTEEGYNASVFNSIQDFLNEKKKRERTSLIIERISKLSPAFSTFIALITAVAGLVTGHLSFCIALTQLFVGIAIGFFVDELIHKIYGKTKITKY